MNVLLLLLLSSDRIVCPPSMSLLTSSNTHYPLCRICGLAILFLLNFCPFCIASIISLVFLWRYSFSFLALLTSYIFSLYLSSLISLLTDLVALYVTLFKWVPLKFYDLFSGLMHFREFAISASLSLHKSFNLCINMRMLT